MNSEQLLFNWQLGRDLVIRRAEEKWGKGVVEQVSLDIAGCISWDKGIQYNESLVHEKMVFVLQQEH